MHSAPEQAWHGTTLSEGACLLIRLFTSLFKSQISNRKCPFFAQDVDQRLTRDVERLCDDLSALIPSLVKPVVDIAWFSVQLYQLTGRRGMAILYLYAFLGFGALSAVTPDFGGLARKVPFIAVFFFASLWPPPGCLQVVAEGCVLLGLFTLSCFLGIVLRT